MTACARDCRRVLPRPPRRPQSVSTNGHSAARLARVCVCMCVVCYCWRNLAEISVNRSFDCVKRAVLVAIDSGECSRIIEHSSGEFDETSY